MLSNSIKVRGFAVISAFACLAPSSCAQDGQLTALSGVVTDADGKPLEGVLADAWTWFRRNGNEVRTSEDGAFRLTNVGDSEHIQVMFSKEGYCPRHYFTNKSQLAGGDDQWRIELRNDTYLEGALLDSTGAPVVDALLRARRGPFKVPGHVVGEVWTETTTDSEGKYRLYLEPDTYDLIARVPGAGVLRQDRVAVAAGDRRTLDLRLEPGIAFRATVLDSETGEAVENIRLWNWQQPGIDGTSDEEGELIIEGMSSGAFQFNIGLRGERPRDVAGNYARWWSPAAVHKHQRKSIPQNGGFQRNFDNLEFDIQPGMAKVTIYVEPCVTIKGKVVTSLGFPVKEVTVAPAKTGSGNSITGDTRYSRQTDNSGRFTLKLPASGAAEYNLVAHHGKYQQWLGLANGVAKPIRTNPGQVIKGVTLTLSDPATVKGRAADASGAPSSGKEVRAVPTDGLSHRYYLPTTKTDADGRFTLKHLRPGEHLIQVEPFWLSAADASDGTSQKVEVKAGEELAGVEITAPTPQPAGLFFSPAN